MIRLIATDMDGTLVNDRGEIEENIFKLIQVLNEKNILFAAASGRLYSQLCRDFKKVESNMVIISHNGGLIKYINDRNIIYSNPISREDISEVLQLKRCNNEKVFISSENYAYLENPTEDLINTFNYYGVPIKILKSFNEIQTSIYKVSYFVEKGISPEIISYLKDNLNENLEFVVSGDKWLDIMNKGTSKGKAIRILQEKFNVGEKDTMVFGDYYNDLTMFKAAYHSYAMENAPEDVKKHAKYITDSNNNNGVYNVIYKYAASL